MVTVKYFADATKNDFELHHCNTLADFLRERRFKRDELLSLRFYKGSILGKQIDTSDGSFLSIADGEIEVINANHLPQAGAVVWAIAAAVVGFVAAIVLTPKIEVPDVANRKQQSATNSLGKPSNEPRIDQRIDDIFGYVANHTPPLWQVPYRVGIDDQETEVLFTCIGRGRYDYDLEDVRDGDTPYFRIPNAKVNIYGPGTYPGNGSPEANIGGLINQPIGIYRESNDLNSSELLPPNDLALGADANWTARQSGSTGYLTLTNASTLGVDLRNYFSVGQDVLLIEAYIAVPIGPVTLYRDDGTEGSFTNIFPHEISGTYEILDVTEDVITITGVDFLNSTSSVPLITRQYDVKSSRTGLFYFTTLNNDITNGTWYEKYDSTNGTVSYPISHTSTVRNPDVGQVFDNVIGPITIPTGSTKILINLTSASGFYKIDGTTDKTVSANIQFVVEELTAEGVKTGQQITVNYVYTSNNRNLRYSVYRTVEINIPYQYSRVYGRRTSDRDKSNNIQNVDKVEWTLLYSFEPIAPGHDFGNVTLMHTVVPSNSQSRLTKDRRTNIDVTRKITQYLGGGQFGPVESYATDDFSQILIHTALDAYIGGLELPDINADGFLLLRQQIIDYFAGDTQMIKFGYDFDSTQMSYDDIFTLICNVVNCIPYVQNGVYDAFFECRQDTSYMQITCRNKLAGSEKRKDLLERKYNGVELTYRNRATGINETIYIPTNRTATRPERFEFPGCTTSIQAYRRALRQYHKHIYHMFDVEFDVDEFGRVIVPGARIDSPDGTRFVRHEGNTDGYRVYDGEVVEVNGLTVELSEPVLFVEGENHYIQFTTLTGENSELILCTPGQDEFTIVLSQPPAESLYDGYSRDRTKFTFCSEQLRESIALIPQTIEFKLDNGQEVNTVTSINYDARYYKGDLETL